MLLYNPKLQLNFQSYGIKIPLSKSRSKLIADKLNIPTFSTENLPIITKEDLLRAHQDNYINELFNTKTLDKHIRNSFELIDSKGNLKRYNSGKAQQSLSHLRDHILKEIAASYYIFKKALDTNFSFYLGGGMHHAMSFSGGGFCLVNDIVIGIRKLQKEKMIKTAWVIDVDAHKGDGTAEITENDPTIKTLSIHMKSGWPLDGNEYDIDGKLNPSFISSDIDIPISKDQNHKYLEFLEKGLSELEEFGKPDLAIIIQGADPYVYDELESSKGLELSLCDMGKRDELVFNFLKKRNIPQAYLMGGGYGEKSYEVYVQFLKKVREVEPSFVV